MFSFIFFLVCFITTYGFAEPTASHDFEKIPTWMKNRINTDYELYLADGIDPIAIEKFATADYPNFFIYTIEDNQVAVRALNRNFDNHPRALIIKSAFEKINQIYKLPEMKFLVTIDDGISTTNTLPFPILTFARDRQARNVILIPDFEALEGNQYYLDQVTQGFALWPYEKKTPMAYWKGSITGREKNEIRVENFFSVLRAKLVTISLNSPDYIYARFTPYSLSFFTEGEKIGTTFPEYFVGFSEVKDAMRYKYQILADGVSCAYSRAFWQLHSNCLMIKQDSPNIQWFYGALHPYVHYVPTNTDFSDIIEKIIWARENDEKVREITLNAQKFARENLNPEMIYLYLYHVLLKHQELVEKWIKLNTTNSP